MLPLVAGVLGELVTGPARLEADALAALSDRLVAALGELVPLATRVTITPQAGGPPGGRARRRRSTSSLAVEVHGVAPGQRRGCADVL